jgi:hypothetical protein
MIHAYYTESYLFDLYTKIEVCNVIVYKISNLIYL